jgi:hypothetical protein
VAVRGISAALGGMSIDVQIAKDRSHVVAEDLGEDGGGETFRGAVRMKCASQTRDAIAPGGNCADIVTHDDDRELEFA